MASVTQLHVLMVTHMSEHHCFLFHTLGAVPREQQDLMMSWQVSCCDPEINH